MKDVLFFNLEFNFRKKCQALLSLLRLDGIFQVTLKFQWRRIQIFEYFQTLHRLRLSSVSEVVQVVPNQKTWSKGLIENLLV